MSPAGDSLLAVWRESGEWWQDEPALEFIRRIDEKGILREDQRVLDASGGSFRSPENLVARLLRSRDDKVEHWCRPTPLPELPEFSGRRSPYSLLHLNSGYAFGRSAMMAESLALYPECQAYSAALLADPFSFCGAIEFAYRCRDSGIQPLIGATFEIEEGGELVLIARSKRGYRNLSRLISECHLDEPRLFPMCTWERMERHSEDVLCLTGGDCGPLNHLVARADFDRAELLLDRLVGLYGEGNVFVQIERSFLPWEMRVERQLLDLAERRRVTSVAGGPITHRRREHFPAQDMLVCVETLCAIDEVVGRKPLRHESQPEVLQAPRRALNGERFLRSPDELSKLFFDRPDLVRNTALVAERCDSDVLPWRTQLPLFCADEPELLRTLVSEKARELPRRPERAARLKMEIECILRNRLEGHFLVAWDMCRWAREHGIVLSGRGSVVDSAVAYCLGLSRIDAFEHNLHFDRFLPADGSKRPDIDIDFEARRREDVRGYLVGKYGDAHVATVAAVGTYGTRGIVREVGKVMGIPQESLSYLVKRLHGSVTPERLDVAIDSKPELRDSGIPKERFRWVFRLAELLMEVPRNLRSHSSGVVVSREPISDTVPVVHSGAEGVKILQWDKRSAKHFFDKFDVLCLRGNDVLSDTQDRVRIQSPDFSAEDLPLDDENVFRTMRAGELIGVPQSASPAMRQAHIRLETKDLADTSIVQAGIRPGVGGAVKLNELIARRKGKPYTFLHESLRSILEPTCGILVFQEQVDQLLQTFAGYTSDEAEETREAIYKRRREEHVRKIQDNVTSRIISRGYSREVAKIVYELVAQFQGYGFAEGHALAFADISIRSVYCQQNFPAEYFSAILDAQPAGYYGPCTLANEARVRGVKILPPNVNRSGVKYSVEDVRSDEDPKILFPSGGIRVSLEQIGNLSKSTRTRIVGQRKRFPYLSFFDFVARVRPARDELETLILCGVFDELHPNRRALLWALPGAMQYAEGVSPGNPLSIKEPDYPQNIEDFSYLEKALYDRRILGLDVERHLMSYERQRVAKRGGVTAAEASRLPDKTKAIVVGNPIRLRFPPTASGKRVMFFDLEDETGLLNVTCFNDTYLRDGHAAICSPYVTIIGEAQHRDKHVGFVVSRMFPYNAGVERHVTEHQPMPIRVGDFLMS